MLNNIGFKAESNVLGSQISNLREQDEQNRKKANEEMGVLRTALTAAQNKIASWTPSSSSSSSPTPVVDKFLEDFMKLCPPVRPPPPPPPTQECKLQ